jgi:predicted short-subunit dehydrogenase-like oxidoreductase (DUF2520 family)
MKSEVKSSKRDRASAPVRRELSIIGAGRLGTALAMALSKNGYQIRAVITKNPAGARRAAKIFGQKAFVLTADPLNSTSYKQAEGFIRSSLILIATPDDVINTVARKMAAFFEQNSFFTRSKMRRTVLHTSGALSSAELQPLKRLGFATGSLHPLISISDSRSGSSMFRDSFFCVEGDKRAKSAAASIAQALGGKTFSIEGNRKALYHAAAVMAAGNMIALFDMAIKMLQRCGPSARRSREVLLPLLKSSIANLETADPADALTGPFARGDVVTVRKHLAAIKAQDMDTVLAVYAALGRHSLSLAGGEAKPRPNFAQLSKLVSDPDCL